MNKKKKGAASYITLIFQTWYRNKGKEVRLEGPCTQQAFEMCLLYLITYWCNLIMCLAFKVASVGGWWTLPKAFFDFMGSNLLKDKVTGTACKHTGQNISLKWSCYAVLRKWKPFRKLNIILPGRATLQPPSALGIMLPLQCVPLDCSLLSMWVQQFLKLKWWPKRVALQLSLASPC